MKIVINAASAKMGGAVTYVTNLLRRLSEIDGDFQFVVFLPPETAAKLGGLAENIEVLPTGIGHAGMIKRMWWEQVTLRRFLNRRASDVLFSTANFGMFRCPVRQILLVRNALYFSKIYREMFLPKHSMRFRIEFELRQWLICQSAKTADVVMTPTRAMLDELRSFVEVKRGVVNPYGVDAPRVPEEEKDKVCKWLESVDNPVVRLLYVSLYSEHKNLSTLLRSLAILNGKGNRKFKLVTTADPGWVGASWTLTHRWDLKLARQPRIAEHVHFVVPSSRKEIESLYQTADIFVFPSLTESFGFPMAEAMSHGLPIVAADTRVNREICGDAAFYFSPLNAEHLADCLQNLAAHRLLFKRLSAKGQQIACRRFSWNAHSERIAGAALSSNSEAIRSAASKVLPNSSMRVSQSKVPVSILVLTHNEEINLGSCLESVRWAAETFVVDSCSTDHTAEVAESLGARVFSHSFEGYAKQRNWALDNLPFSNEWVLMLDADERVPGPLAEEISSVVNNESQNLVGYYIKRRFFFFGRWLRHGGLYPTWILRLFKRQWVRFEERPLNEHAILGGPPGYLHQPFDHVDRRPLSHWVSKHNLYTDLETEEFLQERLASGYDETIEVRFWGTQVERKRWIKLRVWNRLPLLVRPFLFFLRNYFLKLGFLDGLPGLIYHILWSFWLRFLVDVKILERQMEGRTARASGRQLPVKSSDSLALTSSLRE